MLDPIQKLTELYQQMYELTEPECAKCRASRSCCSPEYCQLAMQRAAEFGVTLTPTGHDRLPLMGKAGCIAPPHLRPLCTLHTCDMSGLGFKRDDPLGEWTDKYFELRNEIDEFEIQIYKKAPNASGSDGGNESDSPACQG